MPAGLLAAQPSIDPPSSILTVCFVDKGPLGMGLASRSVRDNLIVTEVTGAAKDLGVRLGLQLHSVQGQPVAGLEFDQVLHLIKTAPRPLELSFEDASGHSSSGSTAAADVSAETSTPRQERSSAEGSVSASPGLAVEYSSVVTGLNQADSDISDLRQKIEAAAAVVRPLQEQLDRAVAEASSLREQTAVAVRSKEDASQRWMTWLAMQTARPLAPSAAVAQSSSAWRIMSPWRGKTAADRESAADSTERAALLARVETANTNMTQVATQLRKADNTVLEVADELADAEARKALLEQQLQLVLKGCAGSLGRLVLQLPAFASSNGSDYGDGDYQWLWGLRDGCRQLPPAFDGAVVEVRLGNTFRSAGTLPCGATRKPRSDGQENDDGGAGAMAMIGCSAAEHEAASQFLPTYQFEIGHEDMAGKYGSCVAESAGTNFSEMESCHRKKKSSVLTIELVGRKKVDSSEEGKHEAANSTAQARLSSAAREEKLVAVAAVGLDIIVDWTRPAVDMWVPLRLQRQPGLPVVGQIRLQTLFIPADGTDTKSGESIAVNGCTATDIDATVATGSEDITDVALSDKTDESTSSNSALETMTQKRRQQLQPAQTAREWFQLQIAESEAGSTDVQSSIRSPTASGNISQQDLFDDYGFRLEPTNVAQWRAGSGHASCMESLQRTAWEEFCAAEMLTNRALDHRPSLLWPFCRRSHPNDLAWRELLGASKFLKLIASGVPTERRSQLWFELAGGLHEERMAEAVAAAEDFAGGGSGRFRELCGAAARAQLVARASKKDDPMKQIGLDVPRTFAGERTIVNTDSGMAAIEAVLVAHAVHNPQVGYCQSLNLIVAHLFLQPGAMARPAQVFWTLAAICSEKGPADGYHQKDMAGLQRDLLVLNDILTTATPKVKQEMVRLGIPIDLIAMEWLVGLFCTGGLPRHTLYRLWDLFFLEGSATLLAMAIYCLTALEGADVFASMEHVNSTLQLIIARLDDAEAVMLAVVAILEQYREQIATLRTMYST